VDTANDLPTERCSLFSTLSRFLSFLPRDLLVLGYHRVLYHL
jgi:hypothetical protein